MAIPDGFLVFYTSRYPRYHGLNQFIKLKMALAWIISVQVGYPVTTVALRF